jgi:hypothetical protein
MDIKETLERIEEIKGQYAKEGQAAVKDCLKAFMEAHPEVEAIRIRGYVPGFNDGDPCTFSINDPEVRLVPTASVAETEGEDEFDEDNEDGEWKGDWDLEWDAKHSSRPIPKKLIADLKSIEELLNACYGPIEEMFGSNFQAVVKQDGEIEVSEYDCGY